MDAEYTASMWGDAGVGVGVGVGVAAQRIMMKYFINCFGYKFTVDEALITQLAVNSVPPVAGTVQYMGCTLNYWYKDLEGLLAGKIAKEHTNQPAFSCASVDFVIGADHRQGSFRASVKIIFNNEDGSVKPTAIHRLGEIECQKDTAELLALAFTPSVTGCSLGRDFLLHNTKSDASVRRLIILIHKNATTMDMNIKLLKPSILELFCGNSVTTRTVL
jgi:hypothetical protein